MTAATKMSVAVATTVAEPALPPLPLTGTMVSPALLNAGTAMETAGTAGTSGTSVMKAHLLLARLSPPMPLPQRWCII